MRLKSLNNSICFQEPLPEPTAAELAKEAEQEAAVFAQAANVDKLLNMLRSLDPAKDNLADNEEIQVIIFTVPIRAVLTALTGTIQVMYDIATKDRQAY